MTNSTPTESSTKPKSNMSLKRKLMGALTCLIVINSLYFYFDYSAIKEMNNLVINLYDKILMAGTYAQMSKNDFALYSSNMGALIGTSDREQIKHRAEVMADALSTLTADLSAVEERAPGAENIKAIDEIRADLENLKIAAGLIRGKLDGARGVSPTERLSLLNNWINSPARQKILARLSDLLDRVVADGYAFRLASVEHTGLIQKATAIFGFAVLFTNMACMFFIFISIFPQLRRLTAICADVTAGAFSKRIRVTTTDEFGLLGTAFNSMLEIIDNRDVQLHEQLLTTNAMLNSLEQGFMMVDRNGICLPIYSQACIQLLEEDPAGRPLWDVLRVPNRDRQNFKDWVEEMMKSLDSFDMLGGVGVTRFPNMNGLTISITYKPLCGDDGKLSHMVVVATDITAETKAKLFADREQAFSRMVSKLTQNKRQFSRFLVEVNNMLAQLPSADLDVALRMLHTIKGGAAAFSMLQIKESAHMGETQVLRARDNGAVDMMVGVAVQTATTNLREAYRKTLQELKEHCAFFFNGNSTVRELPTSALLHFYHRLCESSGNTHLRQTFVETFLYESVDGLIAPYNETMQEIANRFAKKVRPVMIKGGETPIFSEAYADLFASLVHVFRNAIDHGVEEPEERMQLGKDPYATIEVDFQRGATGDQRMLHLTIRDDGRGIDPQILRQKLTDRGFDVSGESDQQVLQHIFDAEFSTAKAVTDVSGRGIGLDAVRSAVLKLKGSVHVESQLGKGTAFVIRVPELSIDAIPVQTVAA